LSLVAFGSSPTTGHSFTLPPLTQEGRNEGPRPLALSALAQGAMQRVASLPLRVPHPERDRLYPAKGGDFRFSIFAFASH